MTDLQSHIQKPSSYRERFGFILISSCSVRRDAKANSMEFLVYKTTKALPLIRPYGSEAAPV